MDEFMCEAAPGGVSLRFRLDRERLAAFRDMFPNARWQKDSGTWFVPDPRAADRINRWIAERRRQEREADDAAERITEENGIEHPRVSRSPEGWAVRTPYDPALTELLRSLPGARWDAGVKRWIVPVRATETLRAVLPRLTELAAEAESRAAERARQKYRVRSPLRW
jgi:hypothetical protein